MSSVGGSRTGEAPTEPPAAAREAAGPVAVPARAKARPRMAEALFGGQDPRSWWERLPLAVFAVLGVFAAAVDGALTAANPHAQPAHLAVGFRVAVVVVLVLAGIFARTARLHARMGLTLLAAVPFVSLWLLNGSTLALPFTIGLLFASAAPAVVCYLLLAHPTGRLRSHAERRLVGWCGCVMFLAWTFLVLTHRQPAFTTPLLRCGHACPQNLAFIGPLSHATTTARLVGQAAWLTLSLGTLALLVQRLARATPPVRRVIGPTVVVAAVSAVAVSCFFLARIAGWQSDVSFGSFYVATAVATPVAILLGLLLERLFMGRALADLLERLASSDGADVERLLAGALHDPTLRVAYGDGQPGRFLDAAGASVTVPPEDESRASVLLARGGEPAGAILFDSQLAEQERYVQAAGEAALMWIQKRRLESDRAISRFELAISRRRVQEAAVEERRRIQRDLHDGAQQRLLAMSARIARLLGGKDEPSATRDALLDIQRELGETLEDVRTLAEGVYPPLLVEYGLARALRSVSRGMPGAITIADESVGRFSTAVEGAVYFTCLEALQNVTKHAGEDASARVQVWCEEGELHFEVADDGCGFAMGDLDGSAGLLNMRDRITALGGRLQIYSSLGTGTVVTGAVPAAAETVRAAARATERVGEDA